MTIFERVVLIDDHEADNVFHEIMIRRAGFAGEVLVFMDPREALDFLRTDGLQKPTCVFLDVNMPMLSGFELLEDAAPLLASKPGTVVVMLTSSSSPADTERARSMKLIKGFETKPLTAMAARAWLIEERPGQTPAP